MTLTQGLKQGLIQGLFQGLGDKLAAGRAFPVNATEWYLAFPSIPVPAAIYDMQDSASPITDKRGNTDLTGASLVYQYAKDGARDTIKMGGIYTKADAATADSHALGTRSMSYYIRVKMPNVTTGSQGIFGNRGTGAAGLVGLMTSTATQFNASSLTLNLVDTSDYSGDDTFHDILITVDRTGNEGWLYVDDNTPIQDSNLTGLDATDDAPFTIGSIPGHLATMADMEISYCAVWPEYVISSAQFDKLRGETSDSGTYSFRKFPHNQTEFEAQFPTITVPNSLYHFQDLSGIEDQIGAVDGTESSAVFTYHASDAEQYRYGIQLDTAGLNHITIGNNYNPGTDKFTMFMRVYIPTVPANRYLWEKYSGVGDGMYIRVSSAGHIFFYIEDGGSTTIPQVLSKTFDNWFDIMVTCDLNGGVSSAASLYVYSVADGLDSDSRVGTETEITTTEPMVFGGKNVGNAHNGTRWGWAAIWDGVVLDGTDFAALRGA